MESTDKPHLNGAKDGKDQLVVEFLPDADEIERRPLPPSTRWTLQAMLAALVAFALWASLSQIDQVVTARGRLVNPLPNVIVQPLETSIIQRIEVRIGQVVRKGDLLATLDPTFTQADEAQVRMRLKSLDNQVRELKAELAGAPLSGNNGADADARLQSQLSAERQGNFKAQQTRLNETVAKLRASLETNKKDQVSLQQRVRSLREIESMQEKLVAQQYGARLHLLEAQEKRLEIEREQLLTLNREQEIKRDLAAAEAEKSAFDKGWRQKAMEDLLGVTRERDAAAEQLTKADKRHTLVNLVAPVDGVILDIVKLSPGSIVKEAESFFTIVPLNGALEAEVQIDSIDVGYVKPGDFAHLKLDAFPFQKHGTLDAKVRTISEDAFRRDNASGQGLDAYYVTRVAFGDATLKRMNGRSRILPGMTVSAEIVVGKRSVMSYLLWPLTKALDESIREP
jgi:hemolysin D